MSYVWLNLHDDWKAGNFTMVGITRSEECNHLTLKKILLVGKCERKQICIRYYRRISEEYGYPQMIFGAEIDDVLTEGDPLQLLKMKRVVSLDSI